MYCGELARMAGVSADTVRYYERRGLIRAVPRSPAGYRLFPQETLGRVQLIQGALAMGFSLKELGALLGERDRGGAPCKQVRQMAAEKLKALETRLREMQHWRRELRVTLAVWDRTLRKTRSGQRAGLLESFAEGHLARRKRDSGGRGFTSENRKRGRKR